MKKFIEALQIILNLDTNIQVKNLTVGTEITTIFSAHGSYLFILFKDCWHEQKLNGWHYLKVNVTSFL